MSTGLNLNSTNVLSKHGRIRMDPSYIAQEGGDVETFKSISSHLANNEIPGTIQLNGDVTGSGNLPSIQNRTITTKHLDVFDASDQLLSSVDFYGMPSSVKLSTDFTIKNKILNANNVRTINMTNPTSDGNVPIQTANTYTGSFEDAQLIPNLQKGDVFIITVSDDSDIDIGTVYVWIDEWIELTSNQDVYDSRYLQKSGGKMTSTLKIPLRKSGTIGTMDVATRNEFPKEAKTDVIGVIATNGIFSGNGNSPSIRDASVLATNIVNKSITGLQIAPSSLLNKNFIKKTLTKEKFAVQDHPNRIFLTNENGKGASLLRYGGTLYKIDNRVSVRNKLRLYTTLNGSYRCWTGDLIQLRNETTTFGWSTFIRVVDTPNDLRLVSDKSVRLYFYCSHLGSIVNVPSGDKVVIKFGLFSRLKGLFGEEAVYATFSSDEIFEQPVLCGSLTLDESNADTISIKILEASRLDGDTFNDTSVNFIFNLCYSLEELN